MKHLIPACLFAGLLAAGCGERQPSTTAAPAEAPPEAPPEAVAPTSPAPAAAAGAGAVQLAPTQGNTANGSLLAAAEGGAVRISGSLQGLAPNGQFGFHIHEKGDCSAPDASSAGEHFNPASAQHGHPDGTAHHAGDMLNVTSDGQGTAQVDVRAEGVTLGDGEPTDVVGRAVVLHEKADDYATQPSGNSGKRIACGVITAG
jgi:Cu-Zn family superoxide dismutase